MTTSIQPRWLEALARQRGLGKQTEAQTLWARPYAPYWHRTERREALETIFHELNCGTATNRRNVFRHLACIAGEFGEAKAMVDAFDRTALETWLNKIGKIGTQFAELLEAKPDTPEELILWRMFGEIFANGHKRLCAEVRQLAEAANVERANLRLKRHTSNFPRRGAVRNLANLYRLYTGRNVGRSIANDGRDTYNNIAQNNRHGTPTGPFHRVVEAFFALVGDRLTPHQFDALVRRHSDPWKRHGQN